MRSGVSDIPRPINGMKKLIAHFLGTFSLVLNGQPLTGFVSARARGLFVFLLYNAGSFYERDFLASLLWPNLPQHRAMGNLRNVLFHLRKMFSSYTGTPFLEITRHQVGIRRVEGLYVDVHEFLHRVKLAEARDPEWMTHLEKAAELYRGDLLRGFRSPQSESYETWLHDERERLHEIAEQVYTQLADYYEQVGLFDRAIHHARNLLRLAPWDEQAHMRLMRLFTRRGKRQQALAQYETFLQIWQEEFNTGPPKEIQEFYDRLKRRDISFIGGGEAQVFTPAPSAVVLPTFPLPFIGRRKEMLQIKERFSDPYCRLITLVGMGGVGKSRFAVEAARVYQEMFPDGVYFIPLETVESPHHLLQAIAHTLHIPIKEGRSLTEQVINFLSDKKVLLILDNFEHLVEARTQILEILQHTRHLKIVITSREVLHLYQEWVIHISGLPYPPNPHVPHIKEYDAVRFFLTLARRVRPDVDVGEENLQWVIEICRRVEGSPLALTLASSWLRDMPLSEVARIVSTSLDLLSARMPDLSPRHQSMRAVFDNSWTLLHPDEQRAFRRLSIFRSAFSSTAAASVAEVSLPILRNLVKKSLLSVVDERGYGFHPLLHAYARERLGEHPEEARTMAERHARYMVKLVRVQGRRFHGPQQQEALHLVEMTWPDIRAAWRWYCQQGRFHEIDDVLESLYFFFEVRGFWEEAFDLLGEAEEATRGVSGDSVGVTLGRIKMFRAWFGVRLGLKDVANTLVEEAEQLLASQASDWDWAILLHIRGVVHKESGDYDAAIRLLKQSVQLSREVGAKSWMAQGLVALSYTLDTKGAPAEQLQSLAEEALATYRAMGDPTGVGLALVALGNALYRQGRMDEARAAYEESLHIRHAVGNRLGVAVILLNLGSIAYIQGRYEEALHLYKEAAQMYRKLGSRFGWAYATLNMGIVAEARHDLDEAQHHYLIARDLFAELKHDWGLTYCYCYLADVYVERGAKGRAHHLLRQTLEMMATIGSTPLLLRVLVSVGHYLLHCGLKEQAQKILGAVVAHPHVDADLEERLKYLLTDGTSQHVKDNWEAWVQKIRGGSLEEALQVARQALDAEQYERAYPG